MSPLPTGSAEAGKTSSLQDISLQGLELILPGPWDRLHILIQVHPLNSFYKNIVSGEDRWEQKEKLWLTEKNLQKHSSFLPKLEMKVLLCHCSNILITT